MDGQEFNILLVEDDDVDVRAIQRAFTKSNISNQIYVANDGIEALDMLRGTPGGEAVPAPHIILLDLNMPRMGGLEFLEELRKDQELSDSIVFVLATSDDDRDKVAAYSHHVAGYLLKTRAGTDFLNVVQMLEKFRISVQFPLRQYALNPC